MNALWVESIDDIMLDEYANPRQIQQVRLSKKFVFETFLRIYFNLIFHFPVEEALIRGKMLKTVLTVLIAILLIIGTAKVYLLCVKLLHLDLLK